MKKPKIPGKAHLASAHHHGKETEKQLCFSEPRLRKVGRAQRLSWQLVGTALGWECWAGRVQNLIGGVVILPVSTEAQGETAFLMGGPLAR